MGQALDPLGAFLLGGTPFGAGNCVRVSYSGLPMRYYFEKTLNDIPCVNSFPLFSPILNLELKIRNHHCAPNSYQDDLIIFISI